LPFIRDYFALDYTQAGWLVSAFTLSYGISQLPAGWLADRMGPRLLITIGISGVALAGLLVGLSPTYMVMLIFLILLGLAGGGYHPASAPLISASVEPQYQGRALGIHQIGGSASYFLTPLIAVGIAAASGWRGSFIWISIPTIVFGILLYVLLGRRGYGRGAKIEKPKADTETIVTPKRWRHLVSLIVLSIAGQAFIVSAISFVPLFLVDQFSVSEESAGAMLAFIYGVGLGAGPLGGYLSDRLGRVPLIIVVSLITGPIIYLLNLAPYFGGILAVLLAIGMVRHLPMPVSEAYIIRQAPENNRSTILGIYYFGTRGGPGAVTPVLGYLIDHFGFHAGFSIVGAAMLVVTIICSILLWESRD
jgi:MFS family permease